MNTEQFKEEMKKRTYIVANSEMHLHMHEMAQRARRITVEMNSAYRTPENAVVGGVPAKIIKTL